MDAFFLMQIPDLSSPEVWVSFLTLTFLEIVLGIDNIVFISIASNKLPKEQQPLARNIGLLIAMAARILLLFGITYLIAMQEPLIEFHKEYFNGGFSGQSLILIAGGIFLLYKSTSEIHHKLEGDIGPTNQRLEKGKKSLTYIIIQIVLIDMVFAFDSILTAIGLTDILFIMIAAVVISIVIMMLFAGAVSNFVNEHPTIQMLALAFLLLIGFMLIAEGAHLAHLEIAGTQVGAVPKGYLYFAIAFSLLVEFLNMKLRRKAEPVKFHGIDELAEEEGIINRSDK